MSSSELPASVVSQQVLDAARKLGFAQAALCSAEPFVRGGRALQRWLARQMHADMAFLEKHERSDPKTVLEEAKTLLVVALPYENNLFPEQPGFTGRIARYALGKDYHQVLKQRLYALAEQLQNLLGPTLQARPCVDTAPLLEREAAHRAGLGFIAKNTMTIVPGVGSYTVLGALVLNQALPPLLPPAQEKCGDCVRCIEACPTGAIVDAYTLDARRCVSYLTIEHQGVIPESLREGIGQMVYGCDICQEVCPFNAKERVADLELSVKEGMQAPQLRQLLLQRSGDYRRLVKGTAMTRASRHQLARNAAVAMGNSGRPIHLSALRQYLDEGTNEMVKEHVRWAIAKLEAAPACESV